MPQYASQPALFKDRKRLEIGLRNENLLADILQAHYLSLNGKGGLLNVTSVSRRLDNQFHILLASFTSGNSLFGGYLFYFVMLFHPIVVEGCGRQIIYGNRDSSVDIGTTIRAGSLLAGTRNHSHLQRI